MKKLILLVTFIILSTCTYAHAQTECPANFVCITQEAANRAAQNARELEAQKQKVIVLESALVEKDKNVAEIQLAKDKNEAELKAALTETQTKLATATGQLIGAEATNVRLTAIIDFMLKNGRSKCNLCIQF